MTQQEDIPGPAAHVLVLRIVHLRPISKLIAVLVSPFRQLVIERDRINTKLRQGVQLRWLGDAVVIGILPKSQFGEDCIVRVDDGVSIAAIYGLIELVQCQKTISLYIGSRRLVPQRCRTTRYHRLSFHCRYDPTPGKRRRCRLRSTRKDRLSRGYGA